jgi:hypothetical protein
MRRAGQQRIAPRLRMATLFVFSQQEASQQASKKHPPRIIEQYGFGTEKAILKARRRV